jgi:DNA-directed RNA polymerase subunit RPC12/RpoP
MAWFRNYYKCANCSREWEDNWSSMSDDDCPYCGARHMSPYDTDDLTEIVEPIGDAFAVLQSSEAAEHAPDYQEIARFATLKEATAYLGRK